MSIRKAQYAITDFVQYKSPSFDKSFFFKNSWWAQNPDRISRIIYWSSSSFFATKYIGWSYWYNCLKHSIVYSDIGLDERRNK